jgi:DNA polymerase elongation subunit (family B)
MDGRGLGYDDISKTLVEKVASSGDWHRVVSIDLETKIEKKEDFLSGERLLAVGLARRAGAQVELKTIKLKDDSDDAEIELINETAKWLHPVKPLILLGYNITGYDYPLLCLKLKWYDDLLRKRAGEGNKPVFPREYWALKDALTRAFILDMMHPIRYALAEAEGSTPKYRSLADVVAHQKYEKVALMRRKGLAAGNSTEHKGQLIYRMWKEGNPDFEKYLEGDVHDVLLLAEAFFGIDLQQSRL